MKERLLKRKSFDYYKNPLVILLIILVFILACKVVFVIRFCGVYVIQNSMSPTLTGAVSDDLPGGDYVYVDRYATPEHGDIVVVYKPDGSNIIKRVIALSGDRVYMYRGTVYVMYAGANQYIALEESYVLPENNTDDSYNTFYCDIYGQPIDGGLLVPNGYMFLLGDNRDISKDSRYEEYGCFSDSSLLGVVTNWSLAMKSVITGFYTFFKFGVVL